MAVEVNALETSRFGVVCARIASPDLDLTEIDAAARAQNVRMISTRVDVSDLARVHQLEANGYRLMDTLIYYERELTRDLPEVRLTEGVVLRPATPKDRAATERVARAAFQGYLGHYHADPRLDDDAADAAYVEWAGTSVAGTGTDAPVWLADKDGTVAGFVAIRLNDATESEIVLNAVHPQHQRGGLYTSLIGRALATGAALGTTRMIISTQINNYAVQRVWARLGFVHFRSLYTFHKWLTE